MATVPVTATQPTTVLDIHHDHVSAIVAANTVIAPNASPDKPSAKQVAILGEVSGNESQSRPQYISPTKPPHSVGELATELENFHIASPERRDEEITFVQKGQEPPSQSSIETSTTVSLSPSVAKTRGPLAVPAVRSPRVVPEHTDHSLEGELLKRISL